MTDGATELRPDELIHLVPSHIKTRGQLNLVEAIAIDDALERFEDRPLAIDQVLDDVFVRSLHHRLVYIHPFVNGNSRQARAYTDLLMESMGLQPFSWGLEDLARANETRKRYVDALRGADQGDLAVLFELLTANSPGNS